MSKYRDAAEGFEAGSNAATAKVRPDCVTDEHLAYLDELRESGSTNMLGARPWLKNAFPELDDKDSATVLSYWMRAPIRGQVPTATRGRERDGNRS